jgi:CDP-glycerol glycerophosphotransferase (TagB/SpsB family)
MLNKALEWRKISLPLVALIFRVLKVLSIRNRKLWVFGCWKGMKYDDNSKFLFEYVNHHYPKIRCVWLTRENSVA